MFIRKYGVASVANTSVYIPIIKVGVNNFAVSADWTPATGDVKITKDGGTPANIATLPVYVANLGWKFVFSLAEMQCKQAQILIVDSATKAIEDQFFNIETFGHASAMVPIDFSDVVRMGMTALPDAVADGAGGLPISDSGGLDLDSKLANTNEITVARMAVLTDWINGGRLDLLLDAIPTTPMRGTDDASLASVLASKIPNILNTTALGNIGIDWANIENKTAIVDLSETIIKLCDTVTANSDMRGTDSANTTTPPTANQNASALLDLTDGVEPASSGTERTVREAFRLILAGVVGKLAGAETTSITIRDTNDTKNRISASVDANGNRTSVTLNDT